MVMIFQRAISYLKSIHIQKYINGVIVGIGLLANLISLGQFFNLIYTPPSASNFYVNSRESLAWILISVVYSVGLLNSWVRRRWRKKYSTGLGNNSILNIFAWSFISKSSFESENSKIARENWNNFKRDFSTIYVFMFLFVFLFSRVISATDNATGVTGSPWEDLVLALINTIWVTLVMMIITSMFEFTMSMFIGDEQY